MRALSQVQKRIAVLALGLAAGSLGACSSAKVSFQSASAPAEVWIAPVGSKDLKQLGSTPLVVSSSEIFEKTGVSGPVAIEYRSAGYATQRAVITDITNVDMSLSLDMPPEADAAEQERVNRIVDQLFEAQRLARIGRNDDALTRIKEVQKDAPYVAASYEIEGGVYLIQKKFKDSLDAYKKAAKLNPKSLEISNMKQQVEKLAETASGQSSAGGKQ